MTRQKIGMMGIALIFTIFFFSCSRSAAEEPRTIKVQGSALMVIPPDRVILNVAIVSRDPDPGKCQAQNDDKVKKVLIFLKTLSIPATDISTSYILLERKEAEMDDKPPLFLGYEAWNRITIVLREMQKYDQLIPGLLSAGVNRFHGIDFDSQKIIETRKMARIAAIQAAKEKAEYLAAELGQKVGVPVTIEVDEYDRDAGQANTYSVATPADNEGIRTLAPSSITVSAQVRVKFKLLDK